MSIVRLSIVRLSIAAEQFLQAGIKLDMSAVQEQDEWLQLGAIEKSKSIVELTRGLNISSVLEIGAGTGAILQELDRLDFAESYYALEPSNQLFEQLSNKKQIQKLKRVENKILSESDLGKQRFDLAILSHVVEHVSRPALLVQEALQVAEYVLVEVPLDATPIGNLRAKIRSRITRSPRTKNAAGHIQFFSESSAKSLIGWCGGTIVGTRLHLPLPQMNQARKEGSIQRRLYANLVWMGSRVVGPTFWGKYYYGHLAILVRTDSSNLADSHPLYFSD